MAKPRKKDVADMLSTMFALAEADLDVAGSEENSWVHQEEWYKRGLWAGAIYRDGDYAFEVEAEDGSVFWVTISKPRQ